MMTCRFFNISFLLLAWLAFLPTFSVAKSKIPCSLRNSNYCKNPKYFARDKRDGCAGLKTNCRQKFCQANCFGTTPPTSKDDVYRLCQINCDPQEVTTLSRSERLLFQERFEDKTILRKREVNQFIDSLLSRLPWCEGECDYDENEPESCASKKAKADDHWSVCAQNCYFVKDIKEHAEMCVQKSSASASNPGGDRSNRKPKPTPPPKPKRKTAPSMARPDWPFDAQSFLGKTISGIKINYVAEVVEVVPGYGATLEIRAMSEDAKPFDKLYAVIHSDKLESASISVGDFVGFSRILSRGLTFGKRATEDNSGLIPGFEKLTP